VLEKSVLPPHLAASTSKKMICCKFCNAIIMAELFRCPDCGQMTVGNETEVNGKILANQFRAKLARRREQVENSGECKNCGKKILKGNICNACASLQFRNSVIVIAFASTLIALMLLYFLHTP
jgi:ribosomal protein L32